MDPPNANVVLSRGNVHSSRTSRYIYPLICTIHTHKDIMITETRNIPHSWVLPTATLALSWRVWLFIFPETAFRRIVDHDHLCRLNESRREY